MTNPRDADQMNRGARAWLPTAPLMLALALVLLAGLARPVLAQRNIDLQPGTALVEPLGAKLDGNLLAVQRSAETMSARQSAEPLLVSVHLRQDAARTAPRGLRIERRRDAQVWGWTTPGQLADLALDPAVVLVTLPVEPVVSALSEGVALSGATDWQLAGYDGAGYTIAVLDRGFQGYTTLLGSELPLSPTTRSFRSDGDLEAGDAHGTACVEVAFDMAPQANYYLVNVSSDGEYLDAVQWLISEEVDIVLCALGWPISGPGNGTGSIAQAAQDALASGVIWVNASGNLAARHWMGAWSDDGDGYLNFTAIDETNELQVQAGEVCRVGMRWDDSWDTAIESFALEIYDDTMAKLGETAVAATGPGDPTRYLRLTGLPAGRYHIAVRRVAGSAAPVIELFTFDQNLLEHITPASSLAVPADVPGVLAVGAVAWDAPTVLESFSSRGPSRGGVLKPDLVAPNRVSSATYGTYVPGYAAGFEGTSASAAHVTGAAALLWQMYPARSAAAIADLLRSLSVDLGVVGPDDSTGYGLLSLGPAVTLTPDPAATLPVEVTPSATATNTTVPSATATTGATPTATETPSETATVTLTPTLTQTPGPTSTRDFTHLPMIYKNVNRWTTPSPTPSDTPTPTTTPTATASPTATPTDSPTPLPSNCRQLIRDGGFEGTLGWQFGVTPSSATKVTSPVHSGLRAARLGILPSATNVASHSSAYQYFTLPWNAQTVTLTFSWQRGTEEPTSFENLRPLTMSGYEPESIHTLIYDQDMQEVILMDSYSMDLLAFVARGRDTDSGWQTVTYDLSPWAGRTVMLYFNVYNDGAGGRTWAYLDDVSVISCTP